MDARTDKERTDNKEMNNTNKQETLCFRCGNACGGCSWADRFVPVSGWTATPTRIWTNCKIGQVGSYCVSDCPESKEDKKINRIHPDGFKPLLYAILNSMVRDYAFSYVKYQENPNADNAIYRQRTMSEIESFCKSAFFEDIVDVLGVMAEGPKLLEMIRKDPYGTLERLKRLER